MTYYTLPKSHNIININPVISNRKVETQTSHSLWKYYTDLKLQLEKYKKEDIHQIVNRARPLSDFFFSKTKFSEDSLKKLNPTTKLFYEILEVITTIGLGFDFTVDCLHIGENCEDSKKCIQLIREENERDENHCFRFTNEDIFSTVNEKRYNYIFYETTMTNLDNTYVLELLQCLMVLMKYQRAGGNCIIKLDHMFFKPVIDILYVLSCCYDKVSVMKPTTSDVLTFERFIVCKNFLLNDKRKELYKKNYFKIGEFISTYDQPEINNISSVVDLAVPNLFLNKVDDVNIIFGQQQLEHMIDVINVFKSKNPDEKIESIKRAAASSNSKSIKWSEKSTIEKTNIFLKQKTDHKEKISTSTEKNCFL